ncbi:copper resistance protein NlpE N-terminal domain-containing protein [Vibrio diabolicus]
MKKQILFFTIASSCLVGYLSIDRMETTNDSTVLVGNEQLINNLDFAWHGSYSGNLPSGNVSNVSDEMEVFIVINEDGTYMLSRSYVNMVNTAVMEEGMADWDENAGILSIEGWLFAVTKEHLLLVDETGRHIEKEDKHPFFLAKQP